MWTYLLRRHDSTHNNPLRYENYKKEAILEHIWPNMEDGGYSLEVWVMCVEPEKH